MAENYRPPLGFDTESIITQHAILAFLVNTLNAQMQVKFMSTTASPFESHNWVMFAFFVALFIYANASVAEIMLRARRSIYHPVVGYIRLFASCFATILLLLILDPILGYPISIAWGCLFLKITHESYKELSDLRCHTTQLWSKLVGFLRNHREKEPNQTNLPPV